MNVDYLLLGDCNVMKATCEKERNQMVPVGVLLIILKTVVL